MNQISINTVPTMPNGIPKKNIEISWLSDVVSRDKTPLDNKNVRFDNDLKSR